MTVKQFRSAYKKRPFKPFTIVTQSGETYRVAHPEAVWQSSDGDTVIVDPGGGTVALMGVEHITEVVFPGAKAR